MWIGAVVWWWCHVVIGGSQFVMVFLLEDSRRGEPHRLAGSLAVRPFSPLTLSLMRERATLASTSLLVPMRVGAELSLCPFFDTPTDRSLSSH